MRRAGTVVGTAQGLVVVRTDGDAPPAVGAELVDDQLDTVGEVVEIFGPVDRPYLAVSPAAAAHPAALLNESLYER